MKKLLTLCLLLHMLAAGAQTTSVLFLGNSYTYTANLPATLYQLALAGGDTIYYEQNNPGGYTFQQHSTNATSLSKIASREWDFVVLQEQSQIPSFPPAQVASQCFPYAEVLIDSIRSNYECTEPVFFMTWGRRDGDQSNCQFYPPLCTFEGMNARLRESYLQMGADNSATVAPCGAAWQQMKLENNTFWSGLYSGDGSHPSAWGTYLNACIFYATLFRQTPVGIPYYSNIGQTDAETLQQLAEDMVLDSLNSWYIGHQDVVSNASFALSGGLSVNFSGASENATAHYWAFGDGESANEQNPQHTYATSGSFTVQHIATSACDADTSYLEVVIETSTTSINTTTISNGITVRWSNDVIIAESGLEKSVELRLFDISGRELLRRNLNGQSREQLDASSLGGLYVIRITDGLQTAAHKLVVP